MKYHQCCLLLASLMTASSFAFAPQPPRVIGTATMVSSTREQEAVENPLLEDRKGHINTELAQRLYKWEQEQRINKNLPRLDYSIRDGLRWVLDLVTQLNTNNKPPNPVTDDKHEDLVQEGVIALMQAMTNFEVKARPQETFEAFAKDSILRALEDYSWGVKTATTGGTQSKPALSMESTVEIVDPLERHYSNREEWEVRAPEQEFVDKTMQYEGEDQMWVHQQQVAAPLREIIPDGDEEEPLLDGGAISPDDLALTDMIRYNVDEFLGNTLEDLESQIVQMRFGLDSVDGIPKTQKDVAYELSLTVSKVRKLQKQALEKLRTAYADRYTSKDEDDHYWQDSV
jgi:RNA polymerase sigma factor (sigma-70 family)